MKNHYADFVLLNKIFKKIFIHSIRRTRFFMIYITLRSSRPLKSRFMSVGNVSTDSGCLPVN